MYQISVPEPAIMYMFMYVLGFIFLMLLTYAKKGDDLYFSAHDWNVWTKIILAVWAVVLAILLWLVEFFIAVKTVVGPVFISIRIVVAAICFLTGGPFALSLSVVDLISIGVYHLFFDVVVPAIFN